MIPRPAGWRLTAVVVGVLAIAAACSADDGDDVEGGLRPFSEVQASDFAFEADPTDLTRGVFRVTTTEPMICAIVWGETEELGRFNNSLAMNGTGIVEHDVFLPDLEPGRTYVFRVQGSTADGTQYRSELGTFTIPVLADGDEAAGGAVPDGPNLALDATVADVSSEFGDTFAAANALDDDGLTEWSSAGDGDDASLTVDLGAERDLAGVEWVTRSMADGTAIVETYTVAVDDGDPLGPFPASTPADREVAEIDAAGRTVRFEAATTTGGNTGAVELRVIGPG